MQFKFKKQIEETVEIDTPCFRKDDFSVSYLNNEGILFLVTDGYISRYRPTDIFYRASLEKFWTKCTECSRDEFLTAFALIHSMTEQLKTELNGK